MSCRAYHGYHDDRDVITCVTLSGAFVPLLAWAFRHFDVARDTPA